jgi:hypothetical protein
MTDDFLSTTGWPGADLLSAKRLSAVTDLARLFPAAPVGMGGQLRLSSDDMPRHGSKKNSRG